MVTVKEVKVSIPVGTPGDGYHARHVDVRLSPRQAHALACIVAAEPGERTQMANGRYVQSAADSVRLMLDRLAEQLEIT